MDEFDKDLPDPKEMQEEIEKFMRDKFGKKVKIVASGPNFNEDSEFLDDLPDAEFEEVNEFDLDFSYRPKEIKEYLDRYVIKQDDAKKAISIAVCDHYNHVRESCEAKNRGDITIDDFNYSKQNVLMLGPTGVGKTYLIKMVAKLIGVPFIKADATRFTEMGYVGANVDDLVRDLFRSADENIELAQYGIIYFDEVDKLAGLKEASGKDVSGRGVQHALLKLMEETEIDLRGAHDMISQMQALMDLQRKGKVSKKIINTKHILFIVSGAFTGLSDLVARRMKTRTIGLKTTVEKEPTDDDLLSQATTKDFIDYGFEPEFIGRLPVRLSCKSLTAADLYKILKESKGSIIHQYVRAFKAYGIDITFSDDALKEMAQIANLEKTGARALMTVTERILRNFKFELPSTKIKTLLVDKDLVINPEVVLKRVLESAN